MARKRKRKRKQEERGTDTALHEKELQAQRTLPPALLDMLRALARKLGLSPDLVQQ